MSIRAVTACLTILCSVIAAPAAAEETWPSYGVMNLEDHKAYFRPGVYLAFMDELQITSRDVMSASEWTEEDGKTSWTQTWSSVSISENLLGSTPQSYTKIIYRPNTSTMTWQGDRPNFLFSLAPEDVYGADDNGEVWLSDNDEFDIRPGDVEWGLESDYYDAAYEWSGGECCLSREEYERVVIGEHAMTCSFVAHKTWDVMCVSRHLATGMSWRTFITRLEDAVG